MKFKERFIFRLFVTSLSLLRITRRTLGPFLSEVLVYQDSETGTSDGVVWKSRRFPLPSVFYCDQCLSFKRESSFSMSPVSGLTLYDSQVKIFLPIFFYDYLTPAYVYRESGRISVGLYRRFEGGLRTRSK